MTITAQHLRDQVEAYLVHSHNDIGGSTQNTIHAFIDFLENQVESPVTEVVVKESKPAK